MEKLTWSSILIILIWRRNFLVMSFWQILACLHVSYCHFCWLWQAHQGTGVANGASLILRREHKHKIYLVVRIIANTTQNNLIGWFVVVYQSSLTYANAQTEPNTTKPGRQFIKIITSLIQTIRVTWQLSESYWWQINIHIWTNTETVIRISTVRKCKARRAQAAKIQHATVLSAQ